MRDKNVLVHAYTSGLNCNLATDGPGTREATMDGGVSGQVTYLRPPIKMKIDPQILRFFAPFAALRALFSHQL